MRILFISHTHPSGGALLENAGGMQRVSYQLIKTLEKRADIELYTETINAGVKGNTVVQTTLFLLRLLFTLPRKSRKFEPDIILFSSMVTASLAWFLRNRLKVPLVTINHGRDVTLSSTVYQRFVPHVFKALDGVISVSRATRQECIERGMNPEKGTALPNGIDTESFQFPDKAASRTMFEQKFGIPLNENKMLLTVGRFVERKGHEWFIKKVLPNVSKNVVYVTIGDGPQLEKVKNEGTNLIISDKIFILGRQSDEVLKQAYAAADLFIMPNVPVEGDMEGFGIVMPEANLAGTPVIASDLEGIKDVISDGENGYKISALDARGFTDSIDKILDANLNLLSNKSRKYVQKQFNWPNVADRYIAYLQSVNDRFNQTKRI